MKAFIKVILIGKLFISATLFAQDYETVKSVEIKPGGTLPDKSFIVNSYGKILPGINISAASTGPFFLRANPLPVPSVGQNFVRTETVLIPGITTEDNMPSVPGQVNISYEYTDGLGRKSQNVTVNWSPLQKDFIIPYEYDAYGRIMKQYLPFTFNQYNGAYRPSGVNDELAFYASPPPGVSSDSRPFNENVFENSPLNRITDVYGPGISWKDGTVNKSVKSITKVNLALENIVRWKYYTSGIPEQDGIYPANQLVVSETTDEDGQITKVYTNLLNQVVLSRVGDGTDWYDTHYIYSPSGLLMIVIQPEGVARLNTEFVDPNKQSFLNRWCFQYKYDDEQRIIEKRVPGWSPEYWASIVYDKWNRPVFTQTPAQRELNEWLFSKYDCFNRVVITGLYSSSATRGTLQSDVNSFYNSNPNNRFEIMEPNSIGYSLGTTFPQNPSENSLITITYFDSYDFRNYSGWDAEGPGANYYFVNLSGFPQYNTDPGTSEIMHATKGYVTGSKLRVLGQTRWLNSVTYYDKNYRAVQVIGENHKDGRDRTTSQFDFTGKALKTQFYHSSSLTSLTVLRELEYDHAGRLLNLYQTTEGGVRVLLASNKYNEIGKLIEKNVHSTDGSNFIQSVDYRYNIRGRLTSLNNSTLTNDGVKNNDTNDLFGIELQYNPVTSPDIWSDGSTSFTPAKLYNGNISAVKWKTDTKETTPGYVPKEKIYGFDYDALNRFEKGWYATNNAGTWNGDAGMFNEAIEQTVGSNTIHYDKNGNIKGIKRYGKIDGAKALIDSTVYNYNYTGSVQNFSGESNRLLGIQDDGNDNYGFKDKPVQLSEEFRFDKNGSLIEDHNKEITKVIYNHLNLPTAIEFTRNRPSDPIDRIVYTYDANGNKLSTAVYQYGTVSSNGTEVWRTDYVGEVQYDNNQLSFASTPEGRVVKNGSGYEYEYFYKDHQNNVRLTYGLLKETVSYRASMEDPPSPSTLGNDEENTFYNIDDTRFQDNPDPAIPKYNFTKPTDLTLSPDKSSQTNGFITEANGFTSDRTIGPAKRVYLSAGDKVRVEVFAKYTEVTGNASIITGPVLVAAVTGSFDITPGENPVLYSGFNNNVPFVPGSGTASLTLPKAYLAYLFFDNNDAFVTSAAVSITTSAYNAFEKLERTFTAPQNGYLYIYVTNESNVNAINGSVYFDEMLIVHQKNNNVLQVTQASDYYPFGLSFNTYQAQRISDNFASVHKNRYGFQGQEFQKDLDLNWSQFKWRMHDPAIGRFVSVDPLSDKYFYNSVYALQENKMGLGIELEGLELLGPMVTFDDGFKGRMRAVKSFGEEAWNFVSRDMWDINTYKNGLTAVSYLDPMGYNCYTPEGMAFKENLAINIESTIQEIPNWDEEQWNYAGTKLALGVLSSIAGDKGLSKLQGLKALSKFDGLAGSIRDINKVGGTENCVNCVVATDATLAGRPASALNSLGPQSIAVLEKEFGSKFVHSLSVDDIGKMVSQPGQRGIVFGNRGTGKVGHVFNVANQKGVVRYLDGQTGEAADLDDFIDFSFLPTN